MNSNHLFTSRRAHVALDHFERFNLLHHAGDLRVAISVIDNGVGIPARESHSAIQLRIRHAQKRPGFGMHGGALLVYSDGPGPGSCFTLELPWNASPANLSPSAETKARPHTVAFEADSQLQPLAGALP